MSLCQEFDSSQYVAAVWVGPVNKGFSSEVIISAVSPMVVMDAGVLTGAVWSLCKAGVQP